MGRELVGEGELEDKLVLLMQMDVVEKGGRAEKGCVCLREGEKNFMVEIQEACIAE